MFHPDITFRIPTTAILLCILQRADHRPKLARTSAHEQKVLQTKTAQFFIRAQQETIT